MRVEIYQDAAGGWRWRLKARNRRIIAESGEAYSRRSKCVDAVERLSDVAGDLSLFEALATAVAEARA